MTFYHPDAHDERYIKRLCQMTARFGWGRVVRHIGWLRRLYYAGKASNREVTT